MLGIVQYERKLSKNFRRYALFRKSFHNVVRFDVREVVDGQAALEAGLYLTDVILKSLQRIDLAGMDYDVVAQHAHFAVARNAAVEHHAAGHVADLADAEHFANRDAALVYFLEDRLQHAGHGALKLVRKLVDDGVEADVDFLMLRHCRGIALRTHIEADDNCVRGRGQQHVALVDGADAAADDANANLLVGELLHHVREHFSGAADVRLQNDVELLDLAFLQLLMQLFQRDASPTSHGAFTRLRFTVDNDLLRLGGVGNNLEAIANFGERFQA